MAARAIEFDPWEDPFMQPRPQRQSPSALLDDQYDPWDNSDDYSPPAPAPPPTPVALGSFGVPINSNQPAGTQDLSYWQSRHDQGLPGAPGLGDIFDANGQVKPGWSRTAKGYEYTAPKTTTSQTVYPDTPTTYDPYQGGDFQPSARRPLAALNYPQFNAPTFTAPQPFAYKDYQLPSQDEIAAEPGFDFSLKQGIKAYENSKAYLGTYLSGGTIKGLNDYARNASFQNADRVIGRSMENYDRNRNNAADTYATNYGISRDVFDRQYTGAKDQWAGNARAAELEYARDWDQYAYEGDDEYRKWKAKIDANS